MSAINMTLQRLAVWALFGEKSSRSSAIIRIGLAILAWSRFAEEMVFFRQTDTGDYVLAVNFFAATTLMALGIFSRFSTLWAGTTMLLMYYYAGFSNEREWFWHHVYLLAFATILCAFTPCGKSYSIDRWLAVQRARRNNELPPPEAGNIWAVRLMAIQVSSVYLWSSFDKLNTGFLSGARMQHIFMSEYYGSTFPDIPGFEVLTLLIALSTVAIELVLGVGLFIRKLRPYLMPIGVTFHAILYLVLPVETFSATMWVLYLAYFDPDEVHAFIDSLQGYSIETQGISHTS